YSFISCDTLLLFSRYLFFSSFFFFTATPPTEFYTLSLHDALPISFRSSSPISASTRAAKDASRTCSSSRPVRTRRARSSGSIWRDRKSTRLNSSHLGISYAVFCLKKKKKKKKKKTINNKNRRTSLR